MKYTITDVFLGVAVSGIIWVALINAALFPECNRITNDCFLIQNLWGA